MKSNQELVSIVVVNWNGKKWLKKCFDTLINQTYTKTEIIVVDNGSSDGSIAFIKKNYPNIILIQNKENYGFPKANNIGVKKAKGNYLLLINNDTWVDKKFIEKLMLFYLKNKYSVISPKELRYYSQEDFKCNITIDPTGSPAYNRSGDKFDNPFFMSVCYFCSKDEYLKTLGFDEDYFAYYEDVDWFWRMNLLDRKYAYAQDVYIHHVGSGSTGAGIKYKSFLWRNQNTLQTLLKNYSAVTLVFILPLYFIQNAVEMIFFIGMLKFDIAVSYVQGWLFSLQNLPKILKKRNWIQKRRVVGDIEILKRMYHGSGKLLLLKDYLTQS